MAKTDDTEENKDIHDASTIASVVETANAEDENDTGGESLENQDDSEEEDLEDDDKSKSGDESEDDESDDDDSEEEDKSKKPESAERKFKQFAADDDSKYISNLEKAYENSSAEALRINTEFGQTQRRLDSLMQVVARDPELATRLEKAMSGTSTPDASGTAPAATGGDGSPAPTDNPFLMNAQAEWREKSTKEVETIVEANPELLSDPELNANVKHWMEVFSAEEYKKTGKIMSGGKAMEAAMRHVGFTDKRKKQDDITSKVKDLAAPTRPGKTRKAKPSSAKNVSDSAYKFGELMGVSKEKVEKFAQ